MSSTSAQLSKARVYRWRVANRERYLSLKHEETERRRARARGLSVEGYRQFKADEQKQKTVAHAEAIRKRLDRLNHYHPPPPHVTKHGHARKKARTPEYEAWHRMKERCGNPSVCNYHNYGGRGIQVCDEWINDFAAFYAYVGPRPSPHHSIDRYPDNDGNYEPGNVRWATQTEQQRNRRRRQKGSS